MRTNDSKNNKLRKTLPRKKHIEPSTTHWVNAFKKIPCFLIGNGPSLIKVNTKLLENYFTIGINRCFLKIDPSILMWQDLALWVQEKKKVSKTEAIKYCRAGSDLNSGFYYFRLSGSNAKLPSHPNTLFGRGSSGSLAFQLAYILGCDPIILVGMDCRYSESGLTNFYGKNPMHREHTLVFCKKALKWIRDEKHGRKIINCSKNKVFEERLTVEEVIEKNNIQPITRKEINKILKNKDK